jgi:hypothetical protein
MEDKNSNLVVTEKDREFSIVINNDTFTVRMPLPGQKATIIAQISRAMGGLNINSFPEDDYEYIKMLVTLNNCIIDSPKWWTGAENCASNDLLNQLWKHFLDSEIKFQEFLKKNNKPGAIGN